MAFTYICHLTACHFLLSYWSRSKCTENKVYVQFQLKECGANHTVRIGNKSFKSVANFRPLWGGGRNNQNSVHEELKSRLNSGDACYYHSVQNLLSSHLLSQNIKITISTNYNFAFCFIWVWSLLSLSLREEHRLRIVEEWKTNLMSLDILFHFLCAQHVSDINPLNTELNPICQ